MKKSLTVVLSAFLVLAIGLSLYYWFSWQNTERDIEIGTGVIINLIQANQDLTEEISNNETDLSETEAQIQSIQFELEQLNTDRDTLREQADFYLSQESYLKDVLNWYNEHYFFQDSSSLISAYAAATGNIEP